MILRTPVQRKLQFANWLIDMLMVSLMELDGGR